MKKKQGRYITFFLLPENYQIIEALEKEIANRRLFNKTVRKHTILNFLLENLDLEDIKRIFQEKISENIYKFEDCTARVRSKISTKNEDKNE